MPPELLTERHREVTAVAEVPDGGDSRPQHRVGGRPHPRQQLGVVDPLKRRDGIGSGVEGEMDVTVDEARQEAGVGTEVDNVVGG